MNLRCKMYKLFFALLILLTFFLFSSCGGGSSKEGRELIINDDVISLERDPARNNKPVLVIDGNKVVDTEKNLPVLNPDLDSAITIEKTPEGSLDENLKRKYLFIKGEDPEDETKEILYVVDVHTSDSLVKTIKAYPVSNLPNQGNGIISGFAKGNGQRGNVEEKEKSLITVLYGDSEEIYEVIQNSDETWESRAYAKFAPPSLSVKSREGVSSKAKFSLSLDRLDYKERITLFSSQDCTELKEDFNEVARKNLINSYESASKEIDPLALEMDASIAGIKDANHYSVKRALLGVEKCSNTSNYTRFSYAASPVIGPYSLSPMNSVGIFSVPRFIPLPSAEAESQLTYTYLYKKENDASYTSSLLAPETSLEALEGTIISGLSPDTRYQVQAKVCLFNECLISNASNIVKTSKEARSASISLYKEHTLATPLMQTSGYSREIYLNLDPLSQEEQDVDAKQVLFLNADCSNIETLKTRTDSINTFPHKVSIGEGTSLSFASLKQVEQSFACMTKSFTRLNGFDSLAQESNIGPTSFNITFTKEADSRIKEYKVYLNNSYVTTIPQIGTPSYQFSNLSPGSNYTVKVHAVDLDNVEDINGLSKTVKTLDYSSPTVFISKYLGVSPYTQGYGTSIDVHVSGLDTNYNEVISVHHTSNCMDTSSYGLESSKASSVRVSSIPSLEAINTYYISRRIKGASTFYCSPAFVYKNYSYNSITPVFTKDVTNPDTAGLLSFTYQDPPNTTSSYSLYYKRSSDSDYTLLSPVASPRALTGLSSDTAYDIYVRSFDAEGNYSDSQVLNLKTARMLSVPTFTLKKDASTDLHAGMRGFAPSVYLTLSNLTNDATYTIHQDSCEGPELSTITDPALGQSLNLSLNTTETIHSFVVKASIDGYTRCSSSQSYTHLGDFNPGTLTQSNQKFSSFTLSWEQMPQIKNYVLKVVTDATATNESPIISRPSINSYEYKGLVPSTPYSFLIQAEDYDGYLSTNALASTLSTATYTVPTITIFPPSTGKNIESGYIMGFSDKVDIEISSLSSDDAETVSLYKGANCTGAALETLASTLEETSKKFINRPYSEGEWSVKRELSGKEACSSTSVSYALLSYPSSNIPTLSDPTINSLKLNAVPLSPFPSGAYYEHKFKRSEELFGSYDSFTTEETRVKKLKSNSYYTGLVRACDRHGFCSGDTNTASLWTTYTPCSFLSDLSYGEWIYVPKINDVKIASKIPVEFRSRADGLEDGELASKKINEIGFCVMKFKASPHEDCLSQCGVPTEYRAQTYFCTSCNTPTSSPSIAPWSYVTQADSQAYCSNIDAGDLTGHLIYNSEWMTIALNAEAQGENWEGGVSGVYGMKLNSGHSDSSDFDHTYFGAMTADMGVCLQGDSKCELDQDGWHINRRTFYIENNLPDVDRTFWDLAGNAFEWTLWDSTTTHLGMDQMVHNGDYAWYGDMVSNGKMTRENSLPGYVYYPGSPYYDYDSNYTGNYGSYISFATPTTGVPVRSSNWEYAAPAGLYYLYLHNDQTVKSNNIGFRCVMQLEKIRVDVIENDGTDRPVFKLENLDGFSEGLELHSNATCTEKLAEGEIVDSKIERLEMLGPLNLGELYQFYFKVGNVCLDLDYSYLPTSPCAFLEDAGYGEWVFVSNLSDPENADQFLEELGSFIDETKEGKDEQMNSKGLCVMKYMASPHKDCIAECKVSNSAAKMYECSNCTVPTSSASGIPLAYVNQWTANAYCNSISVNSRTARLMYNSEWMRFALSAQGKKLRDRVSNLYWPKLNREDISTMGQYKDRKSSYLASASSGDERLLLDFDGNVFEWSSWNSDAIYLDLNQMNDKGLNFRSSTSDPLRYRPDVDLFHLDLNLTPTMIGQYVGFRCVLKL